MRIIKHLTIYLFVGCILSLLQSCQKKHAELYSSESDEKLRLENIKAHFYEARLDEKLKPNINSDLKWEPDWSHPEVQKINDSISYTFYKLQGFVKVKGQMILGKEIGAATYLMVRNSREYFKASYRNAKVKTLEAKVQFDSKTFTGSLLLSNLKTNESFLINYAKGQIQPQSMEQRLGINNTNSKNRSAKVMGWQQECRDEMRECTYVLSGTPGCTIYPYSEVEIVYSESCTHPGSICGTAYWLSDFAIKTICVNVWFPDPPTMPGGDGGDVGNGGGSGNGGDSTFQPSAEDPGYAYEVRTAEDKLDINKRFDCFKSVPDNSNTIYSAKLCADLPNNNNFTELFNFSKMAPGHAFITLTKSNGSHMVTETIGFYPESGTKSVFGNYVESQINDDGRDGNEHEYNASLNMNVGKNDFDAMLNLAKNLTGQKYNLKDFNCTDYAIAVFNEGRPLNNKIEVTDWVIYRNNESINYGTTPNGLYSQIRWKKFMENDPNASITIGKAKTSTKCN